MPTAPNNLSELEITVRYAETDAMRMVYYANYLIYFEVARTSALADLGHPYVAMEADGLLIPVLEAECRYIKPARYGDTLRMETRRWRIGNAKIRFEYQVFRDRELLVVGSTLHAFMNAEGKATKPPRSLLSLFPNKPTPQGVTPSTPGSKGTDLDLGEAFEGRR
jgi:acyl-CoA thioester hydrolase